MPTPTWQTAGALKLWLQCGSSFATFGATLRAICPTPPHLQTILNTIHIMHKPDVARQLVANSRLLGESDEAAAARWRQVVVSWEPSSNLSLHVFLKVALTRLCCRLAWVTSASW